MAAISSMRLAAGLSGAVVGVLSAKAAWTVQSIKAENAAAVYTIRPPM